MSGLNQKDPMKKSGRGGPRPGSGRPKGVKDRVTVQGILEALENKTGGQSYEEILIEDFVSARLMGDTQLIHKYHTLLSNKFVANLTDIKVENIGEDTDGKQTAFLEAVNSLININNKKDNEDASD